MKQTAKVVIHGAAFLYTFGAPGPVSFADERGLQQTPLLSQDWFPLPRQRYSHSTTRLLRQRSKQGGAGEV